MLTPHERETIITFNDGDELAELYTTSPAVMRRLEKAGIANTHEDQFGRRYTCHRGAVVVKVKGGSSTRVGGRPKDLSEVIPGRYPA